MVVGRISKRDAIKIEVAIADVYVPLIRVGDTAQVSIPVIRKEKYPARISRISSAANAKTGTVGVTVSLDTRTLSSRDSTALAQFRTGLVASVELPSRADKVYPIVPKVVIEQERIDEIDTSYIYIVEGVASNNSEVTSTVEKSSEGEVYTVSKRVVQVGKEFVGNVEIISGLSRAEAERAVVIISGMERVSNGAEVALTVVGSTDTF